MEAPEFLKLAEKLGLEQTQTGAQRMEGSARDIIKFLGASGQPEIEHTVLGIYGAMHHGGLDYLVMDMEVLDGKALDDAQLSIEISPTRLIIERKVEGPGEEDGPWAEGWEERSRQQDLHPSLRSDPFGKRSDYGPDLRTIRDPSEPDNE